MNQRAFPEISNVVTQEEEEMHTAQQIERSMRNNSQVKAIHRDNIGVENFIKSMEFICGLCSEKELLLKLINNYN